MVEKQEATIGTVAAIWRYPVKSMMGEELNSVEVTEQGLLGDRAYALVDVETGMIASAKNPRKWPTLFDHRAVFVEPPRLESGLPPVRITLPDGVQVASHGDAETFLSGTLGRDVRLAATAPNEPELEEFWPDIEGLDHKEIVTDEAMPEGTFFDLAVVHLLTTATIDRLRALYPSGRFEPRRFRPNIVIDSGTAEGFVENTWVGRTISIGGKVRLRITDDCPRCVMTTLPQGDLPKDPGILRTAAQNNGVHVGVYADVVRAGQVRRGSQISLE
ncbi:MAG: MOSC domain-containing protein [Chloroflexota bacterium]